MRARVAPCAFAVDELAEGVVVLVLHVAEGENGELHALQRALLAALDQPAVEGPRVVGGIALPVGGHEEDGGRASELGWVELLQVHGLHLEAVLPAFLGQNLGEFFGGPGLAAVVNFDLRACRFFYEILVLRWPGYGRLWVCLQFFVVHVNR